MTQRPAPPVGVRCGMLRHRASVREVPKAVFYRPHDGMAVCASCFADVALVPDADDFETIDPQVPEAMPTRADLRSLAELIEALPAHPRRERWLTFVRASITALEAE